MRALTVGPASIYPGDQFGGKRHSGDEHPVGLAGTLTQPPPTGRGPFRQRLMQTHQPTKLAPPDRERRHHVRHHHPLRDGLLVRFGKAVDDQLPYQRGEPSHNDVGEFARFQGRETCCYTEPGIDTYQSDPMPRRQHGQRLGEKLSHTVGCPRMASP